MRWRAYAQLIRLPNIFTAISDAMLGTWAAGTWNRQPGQAAALVAASATLYSAGMVWNDYFDAPIDRLERPFRPIPSGRVSQRSALILGAALLLGGIVFATLAGWDSSGFRKEPLTWAGSLILAILLYDAWLKKHPIGPVSMASCRFLNLLLATSLAEADLPLAERLYLASTIALYIAGVTWLSRHETAQTPILHRRAASLTISFAAVSSLGLATFRPEGTVPAYFPYLIAAFVIGLLVPLGRAMKHGDPRSVQAAVKSCILGLILFDACLATLYAGWRGLALSLLIAPAMLLGRLFYST
jgi:4-hydroxybenzoate polyprenyltransferase